MNWLIRSIDEFAHWLITSHNTRMRLLREDQERRERNRRQNDLRNERQARKSERRIRVADALRTAQARSETQELLTQHRSWNATRGGGSGKWQHFG